MKILFLIQRYPGFGGIETVTTVLANYFLTQHYDVAIISYKQEHEELLSKLDKEVQLFRFPDKQDKLSTINEIYLKQVIHKFQPHYVINQESYSGLFKLLTPIKNEISASIITVEHNAPLAKYKMLQNFLKNEKWELGIRNTIKQLSHPILLWKCLYKERKYHQEVFAISDAYILLSRQYIPMLKKMVRPASVDKIHVIENPVTVLPSDSSIAKKEKTVLYVGRLDYNQKRVDRLLKIWGAIAAEVPEWKLVLVGDGPDREALENYVVAHKISNISFKGTQTNVEQYYAKASILCMTSNVEGFPLVLAEAMTFGCVPIIYNSFESASDIIENHNNGRLIDPFNEQDFKDALLALIQHQPQRTLMSQNAIKACSRFTLEKIGEKWDLLLKE